MRVLGVITIALLFFSLSPAFGQQQSPDTGRFQIVDDSLILDSQSGLMWASKDNGSDIDWDAAQEYCQQFTGGGYSDWRLPSLEELATLYTKDRKNQDGYHIIDPITLTACCVWSSDTSMGGASSFSFASGSRPFSYQRDTAQLRALPVRSTSRAQSP